MKNTERKPPIFVFSPRTAVPSHLLTLLVTDLAEPGALIQQMYDADDPAAATNTGYVWYRMPYTPPYKHFEGLRGLILHVREAVGLQCPEDFSGMVAVDITPWICHEEEDYFIAFVKYLYDNGSRWNILLSANIESPAQLTKLRQVVARYITPRAADGLIFTNSVRLSQILEEKLKAKNHRVDKAALAALTQALQDSCLAKARSLDFLERVTEELAHASLSPRSRISFRQVKLYLSSSESLPSILAGEALGVKEEENDESVEFCV